VLREIRSPMRTDRFVLLERLGRGGQAEVWRARREGGLIDHEVCIKRPLYPLGPAERRVVLEEARILARVRHANVISLLDAVEDETGGIVLVLELVRGVDLRTLQTVLGERGRRLSPAAVATVGVALCRALAAAQRAFPGGIVHRDVSPHNVLLSSEGEIKLADFGIARARDRERWTAAGRVKGKTAYLSPEQLRGDALSVHSDLFAVGIVLYELLTGSRPFADPLASRFARHERAPLFERAPAVPESLASAVERLLSAAVADRPASADHAARLLGPALVDAAVEELAHAVRAAKLWRCARRERAAHAA
jgi:eukaryotic-like serine/threonine-protein kinase